MARVFVFQVPTASEWGGWCQSTGLINKKCFFEPIRKSTKCMLKYMKVYASLASAVHVLPFCTVLRCSCHTEPCFHPSTDINYCSTNKRAISPKIHQLLINIRFVSPSPHPLPLKNRISAHLLEFKT